MALTIVRDNLIKISRQINADMTKISILIIRVTWMDDADAFKLYSSID